MFSPIRHLPRNLAHNPSPQQAAGKDLRGGCFRFQLSLPVSLGGRGTMKLIGFEERGERGAENEDGYNSRIPPVQRSAKRLLRGCEKFVPALAYLFSLALPGSRLTKFAYLLADLCIEVA